MIHPSSIISKKAIIHESCQIGPFTIIDENVQIGEGNVIHSNVHITGNTKIGKNNIFYPFSSIGAAPQDKKFQGENSSLHIGNNNNWTKVQHGRQDADSHNFLGTITASGNISSSGTSQTIGGLSITPTAKNPVKIRTTLSSIACCGFESKLV